jgi:hypothetical protein
MPRRIDPTNRRRLPGKEAYVVTALRRKYAELKGVGDADNLAHVGAALLLFKPDEDLAAIPAIRPYKAHRERWAASVMSILRRARRPMTGRELTYAVMAERGIPATDIRRLKSIECSLHIVLGRLEGDGIERASDDPTRWAVEP